MKKTMVRMPVGRTVLALVMIFGLIGTAKAEDREWRGHARDARAWHNHYVHHGRPIMYGQADPYVVYAPPTEVEPPEPGINVILPLNFR